MRPVRTRIALLAAAVLLAASPALAQQNVCGPVAKVPLERYLRQLSLDLLGRPPTLEEYRRFQQKGSVTAEDIREMMTQDEFYARIRSYHRALLWSNISSSVFNNGDTRLSGAGTQSSPFFFAGNPARSLRGANGATCDAYIPQDNCNASRQDPHAEPAEPKQCHDEQGVPLPVSYDYDTTFYACARLDQNPTDATITSCQAAVTKGRLDAKYLNFCDMRRVGTALVPHLCRPDPARSNTLNLTQEVLDASNRVVAFTYAGTPPSGANPTRLDRCSLAMPLRGGVKGTYTPQLGCLHREGYVVRPAPYWATATTDVYMCAVEGQSRPANPWTLETCETGRFASDRSCGCGDRGRRCEIGAVHNARVAAINAEPELIAESVVRRDEPYFNLLNTRRSFVNGPLSRLYVDKQGQGVFNVSAPADGAALPDVPYTETATWREYVRGEQHAGVLTTASYLYRFPTWRARVNHFYEAFLCKSFVPPSNVAPPAPEDACNRENNLARRCGCNYCHATIEPTGAFWGRFTERSARYLEPNAFPRFDPKCRDCALAGNVSCGGECEQYIMQAYDGDGASSLGMLKTYLYRLPSEEPNIDGGPKLLVERMLQTGDLERCAVRRVWQEFLGRPMSAEEQRLYLEPLAEGFAKDGYRFKSLIERVVMTEAYRRMD